MERLTRRMCGGYGVIPGCELNTPEGAKAVIDRLAAYEGAGLAPEDIEGIIERGTPLEGGTAELLREYLALGSLGHLREMVEAEQDGRLVVLPCKKGAVLWSFFNYPRKGIYSFCITATSTLDGVSMLNTDKLGVIPVSDVGKTVFLTREEAKAALEKSSLGEEAQVL